MRHIHLFFFLITFSAWSQKPKLVVGIVVDQMCYDYLYRFKPHFGKDGFNRFLNKGVNCRNTTYNYVPTYTGPGHASIYTGTSPSDHGIVANDWYSRADNKSVNCVYDSVAYGIGNASQFGHVSPHRLETMTITDQLRFSYPDSKVFSISIKDRGAVLPGGQLSNGSFWFDYETGKFISSSFFMKNLPPWLESFNSTQNADTYLQDWNLLHPLNMYSRQTDSSPYEVTIAGKVSPEFPYLFTKFDKGNYNQFTVSPFANNLLTDLAVELIKQEKLGQGEQTDMLCMSYSTPDIAGHTFGPYSLEIEDIYARLDKNLETLFDALDKQLGKNNYLVFLTADHAVVPVPQQLKDLRLPGGYFDLSSFKQTLQSKYNEKYGASLLLEEDNLNVYLDHKKISELGLNQSDVEDFTADIIQSFSEVKTVVTAHDILSGHLSKGDEWMDMLQKGYVKSRSGDVLFILKPGYLPVNKDEMATHKGTSHGSAFSYDTHVPLLWYGLKLKNQDVFRPIEITDISPTLIHFLNLQRMGSMTGKPILELLGH